MPDQSQTTIEQRLREVHGDGLCGCGKPKAAEGSPFCSYPHGRLPMAPIDRQHPEGFWSWEKP